MSNNVTKEFTVLSFPTPEIMSDITQYFSLQDRITALEADNAKLRKKLERSQTLTSKHKVKWRKLYEKHNPPIVTRSDKAMILIAQKNNGELKMTLRQIATKCFITYQHARSLSVTQRKNNVKFTKPIEVD